MTEPFRVLLVGAGEQAWESRGPSIQELAADGVELAALASPGEERRAFTADRLGIGPTYSSMSDALADQHFDGVVIAAPSRVHEPLAIEAVAAGCHVLCEKPIALDAASGRRMVDAARRAGRVLVIGYQYPWMHPGLHRLAEAGELETTFRVEAHWMRANGIPSQPRFWDGTGGAAEDLLGHLISVMRLGIEAKPRWVTALAWDAFGKRAHGKQFASHDTLETLVTFEGGRTAHMVVAWAANIHERESIGVTFHGTELSLEVPLIGRRTDVDRFKPIAHRRADAGAVETNVIEALPVQTEQTFVLQARDWIEACRARRAPRFPAQDAVEIQALLDAAQASAEQSGDRVEVGSEVEACR